MMDKSTEKEKSKLIRYVVKAAVCTFAILGLLFIVMLFLASNVLLPRMQEHVVVKDNTVISIDFNRSFAENSEEDILSEILGEKPLSLYEMINAIEAAAYDDRIKAIVALIDDSGLGMAQTEDIMSAIRNFREQGKKTYVYSQGFGTLGGGLSEYYLATAFDEIWMQPNSILGITGISVEIPFVKKLLDKIGVTTEFYARYEYKNAISSVVDEHMKPIYREQLQDLVDIFGLYVADKIGSAKGIEKEKVVEIINRAPIFAEEAKNIGLIHNIGYRLELFKKIGAENAVDIEDYATNVYHKSSQNKIAVMFLDGIISSGYSVPQGLQTDAIVGADTVLRDIEEISKNEQIKALVLRVNSPGGDYNSAAEIWYALENLKKQRRIPIVVSQGDYAASGGYFVSLPADYIYTQPLTLTGSIGVFGGKIIFSELAKKFSVNVEGVKFGKNAAIGSHIHNFSPAEAAIFNKSLDVVYKDFVEKVAKARNIDLKDMDKLARGRIWSGNQAVENKLADGIGGLQEAIEKAAKLAELEVYEPLEFPRGRNLKEKIIEIVYGKSNISVNKVFNFFGFNAGEVTILQRIKNIAAYMPIDIKM